ncbi:MAG TPA: hypothetical protein VLY85_04990 [Thermoplasmata archaeon]|nr:hypothetical protein [Thermoplasmata archaeon]
MKLPPSDVRALCIAPVFVYVTLVGFWDFAGWNVVVVGVIVAMTLPLVELFRSARGWLFAPAWVLAMVMGIALTVSRGVVLEPWADVGAGVLLGAPLPILAGLLLWRDSKLGTLLGVEAGLAALASLLVSDNYAATGRTAPDSAAWIFSFAQVNSTQLADLSRWVQGGPASTVPPLAALSDPVFVALAVLAALAIVLALLERPLRAGAGPDPWDPHFPRSSGIAALVVAAFAALAFEWSAAATPKYTLLSVVVGVIVTLGAIGLLSIPRRQRRPRPAPEGPPTEPGSQPTA